MKPLFYTLTILIVLLTSCGKQSSEYKRLKPQEQVMQVKGSQ